jgi:hypothetical protein
MEATQIDLSVILLGAALPIAAFPVVRLLFLLNINVVMLIKVLQKLIAADNIDRAIKLCAAAPSAVAARGTRALLTAYTNGVTDSLALRKAFEQATGGTKKTIAKFSWMSWAAIAIVAAGALLSMNIVPQPYHFGLGGASLVLAYVGLSNSRKISRGALMVQEKVIEALESHSPAD